MAVYHLVDAMDEEDFMLQVFDEDMDILQDIERNQRQRQRRIPRYVEDIVARLTDLQFKQHFRMERTTMQVSYFVLIK